MNRKSLFAVLLSTAFAIGSCGSGGDQPATKAPEILKEPGETAGPVEAPRDPSKGIGKFQNVELTHPLDEAMVKRGEEISDIKCASCHKMTDEKLVGPGWKGVTDRRTPEWIMNFVTNVDEMLDKDPESQALLEICMVRMPNQNLSDADARSVLEYMRKLDGKN